MKKSYILLNNDGIIVEKRPHPVEGFIEAPADVICGMVFKNGEFKNPVPTAKQLAEREKAATVDALAASDKDMARVAEDIIAVLIEKNALSTDDLPPTVREKLEHRKNLRESLK